MAFKQYTHCAQFDDFKNHWQGTIAGQGAVAPLFFNGVTEGLKYMLLGALAGGAIGAVAGGVGVVAGALFGADAGFSFGFVQGFCDQWLNWRLICVKGDQCAAGRVAWIETVAGKFGDDPIEWLFDNDTSFNLRLVPYNGKVQVDNHWRPEFAKDATVTYNLDTIVHDPYPPADILRAPRKADGTDWGLSYLGYEGNDKPEHPGGRWTLHCEIEGNGMQTLCTIAKVLAVLGPLGQGAGIVGGIIVGGVAGAVKGYEWAHDGCKSVCSVPILCDVVCVIVGAAAAVAGAFVGATAGAIAGAIPGLGQVLLGGVLSAFVRDDGSFKDVANDPDSGTVEEEDCVIVFGDQVYDAGHKEGWLEIHPVKHLQKLCLRDNYIADKDYPPDPSCCPSAPTDSNQFKNDPGFRASVFEFWDRWCAAVGVTHDPLTVAAQQEPQNQWCVHPLIDGCRPPERAPR